MRSTVELAWFAGLFEGEGSMHARHRSATSTRAQVQIASTDLDVLQRVVDVLGFGKIYEPYAQDKKNISAQSRNTAGSPGNMNMSKQH